MLGNLAAAATFVVAALKARSAEPTPTEAVLRAVVVGHAVEETLRETLSQCAQRLGTYGDCGRSFLRVVEEVAKTEPAYRDTILSALEVNSSHLLPTAVVSQTARFRDIIERGGPRWVTSLDTENHQTGQVGPAELSRASKETLPMPAYREQLMRYLAQYLPAEPAQRIQDAIRQATDSSCDTVYGGSVERTCEDLGIADVRWASLWIGVADLKDSEGADATVRTYLNMDRTVLIQAIEFGARSTDDGLSERAEILSRWITTPPTSRWQAWLEIEEMLGP